MISYGLVARQINSVSALKKFVLSVAFVSVTAVLISCGGGGGGVGSDSSSAPSTAASPAAVAGRVIDGYLAGAVVFWDCNRNQVPDAGEVQVTTSSDGSFSIARSSNTCQLAARVLPSSIDSDSGSSPGHAYTMYPLRSEEIGIGSVNITPLTTLASTNPVWTTEAQAVAALKDRLGIAYSPSTDVLAITGDPAATHQANVARIVARLLQLGEASALVTAAQQAPIKAEILDRATTAAKTLPTTYHLAPGEVTYINWITGSSGSLTSLFLGPAGSVMLVPGTGLTDDQRAYLATLVSTDADVLGKTRSGTVAWSRLELKKLASINHRLRELGFYSENDQEVLRIRQRRMEDLSSLSLAYNIELYDQLGTKPDAWTWNPINALRYAVLGAYTSARPQDLILLANNTFKFFIGEAKAYFGVPAPHAFAGTIGVTATDGIYKKWEIVYKSLEFLGNGATCVIKLSSDWAAVKASAATPIGTAKISSLTFDAISCAGDLLNTYIVKLLGNSGSVVVASTLDDWLELTRAVAELANTVISADIANPVANQISGMLDILLAFADSLEIGARWEKSNGNRIAIAQDQILQQYFKDADTILRRYVAMETERALKAYLQPYSDTTGLQPDQCRPPLVSRGNGCVAPLPSFAVIPLDQEAVVGTAISFTVKMSNIGLMPKSAYLEVEGATCSTPFAQTMVDFSQTCVFASSGAKAVRVFQSSGNQPVPGGIIKVVPALSAAPVISNATVVQVGAVMIANFVVSDIDSTKMRLIRVAVSNDSSRPTTCWSDATDLGVGAKSVAVGTNTMNGCKGVFPSSGSEPLRVTINVIDDSYRSATEWRGDLSYVATILGTDAPPVINGFSFATPIPIGTTVFANGTVTDDSGLVSIGLEINGINISTKSVSGKSVSLGSLGFDSRSNSYAGTPGTYSVVVNAHDTKGQVSRATSQVVVSSATTTNQAPTLSSAVAIPNADGSLTVAFTANDPEGGTVGANLFISNAGGGTFNAVSKKTISAAASGTSRSITWTKAEADSFMVGGQTYAVRVDAFDSAGAQTQRATNSFTRAAATNQAPTLSSAVATPNADGSLTATFTASDPEGGTVGADLYISNAGGSTFNSSSKRSLTAAASGTSRSITWTKAEADSFMVGGQTYAVRVDAFDSAGAQTQRATNSFTRAAAVVVIPLIPTGAAPGNTTATGPLLGAGSTFNWGAVTGASEYEVVFFDVAANAVALTVRLADTSFLLGTYNLAGGSRVYSWRVAACNSAGCSSYTSELRFRRQ